MKRFYLVAALAATAMAAAFFTSCDKQDEVTPPQPESAALGFQSVVTAALETRAAGDPTPLNASFKINLDTNDAYSTAVNNQEVKYTVGSGYSISPAIYLLKSSRNMVAWAPVGIERPRCRGCSQCLYAESGEYNCGRRFCISGEYGGEFR